MGRSYRSLVGKLNSRVDLQRNIKRAGCISKVGRRVELSRPGLGGNCCCKPLPWVKCKGSNGRMRFIMSGKGATCAGKKCGTC